MKRIGIVGAGRFGMSLAESLANAGSEVLLPGDGQPVTRVRYAWAGFCETNLFGANGLPAKTFHTGIPV